MLIHGCILRTYKTHGYMVVNGTRAGPMQHVRSSFRHKTLLFAFVGSWTLRSLEAVQALAML